MKNRSFKALLLVTFSVLLTVSSANAQVDVARKTTAITYPLDQQVMVNFRGTTRFPRMKGEAKVGRTSRNGTEISLSVSKMPRPFELGAGYATYVLWAIAPNGQADNLGEIKRRGFFEFDSKISVTTRLQTFALVITAEPHFMVTRPSQEIMLENLNPYTTSGKTIGTMTAVQYFGNSSDFFRDSRTPEIAEVDYAKIPPTILQAKQAVALAKFAGAERDATEELREAEVFLQNAESAWAAGRENEAVDIAARKSISASVKAEVTATTRKQAREQRNEKSKADAEVRRTEEKFADAQGQIDDLKAELARETRNRELAERDALNFSDQVRDLRSENGKLREDLGRLRVETEAAKSKLAAIENEKVEADNQRDRATSLASARAAEGSLMSSLKPYGAVAKVDGSVVLVLNENIWTGTRSTELAARANATLAAIADILQSNPEYFAAIESYTDNTGQPDDLQTLTENRAQIVADKLMADGVSSSRIRARGFGDTIPAVKNSTAANKAKNRRMHLILTLPSE